MRQFRLVGVVLVSVMMAIMPLAGVANAQSNEQAGISVPVQVAQAKAQVNLANDLAQCALQAAGAKYLRGGVGISQPPPNGANTPSCTPMSGTAMTAWPSSSTSSTMKRASCVEATTNTLTTVQYTTVNAYAILVARANSAHTPVPTMSPEVAAIIGCL